MRMLCSDGGADCAIHPVDAFALSLLLQVKVYLKQRYALTDLRCLNFVPSSAMVTAAARMAERAVLLVDCPLPAPLPTPASFEGRGVFYVVSSVLSARFVLHSYGSVVMIELGFFKNRCNRFVRVSTRACS